MSQHKRILVVDDEPDLLELMVLELEFAGVRVTSADGYDPAVEMLQAETFDFVISDIRMPGKGGMGLLDYCQQHHPHMGVILMTGYAEVSVEIALHAGAINRLDKPFSRDVLRHALLAFAVEGIWQLPLAQQPEFEIALTEDQAKSVKWGCGGFSFAASGPFLDVGTPVEFSVPVPGQESAFKGDGVIRWLKQTDFATICGLSYGTVNPALAKKLLNASERNGKKAFIPSQK